MEYTSNYHLSKPEGDDIINPTSRTGYNGNFDTLDTTLELVSNKANTNESNITTLQGDVTTLQGDVTDLNAKTGDDIPFESGSTDSISDKINILSNNVSDLQGHDYIVEQGTSGIWTYRKWNSGFAECITTNTQSESYSTNLVFVGPFYRDSKWPLGIDLPFTFASKPSVKCTIQGASGFYFPSERASTTKAFLYMVSPESRTGDTVDFDVSVIGRWK